MFSPNMMKEYAIEKMAAVWTAAQPEFADRNVRIIRGNSNLREHQPGIISLQTGKSVCYVFDLTQNVRDAYERMLEQSRKGQLVGEDLHRGMIEGHEYSGIEDNLAYLVMTAFRPSDWWAEWRLKQKS